MSILKIARMGHPILRKTAVEIADPFAPEIRRLATDMVETLLDAGGAGLAGPQVHAPLRIMVFQAPQTRNSRDSAPDPRNHAPLTVLMNPKIEVLDSTETEDWEACLSLPTLMGRVPRASVIRYTGIGPDGQTISREATGFHARVVQHEYDHLDGILYPRRVKNPDTIIYDTEVRYWLNP